MEGQTGLGEPKKEYPRVSNQYLTLFEQRFIGGSERVGEKLYDLNTAIKDYKAGQGILPEEYSKTLAQLRDGKSPEEILEHRRTHYITGILGMFGESSIDVYDEGYNLAVQLPVGNEQTRNIPYGWKVTLVPLHGGSDVNSDVFRKLKLEGELQKILHTDNKGDFILVRLKTWEEYNAG